MNNKQKYEFSEAEVKSLQQRNELLETTLRNLLANPYDSCPMCDLGKLRDESKKHWPDCQYLLANKVLLDESHPQPESEKKCWCSIHDGVVTKIDEGCPIHDIKKSQPEAHPESVEAVELLREENERLKADQSSNYIELVDYLERYRYDDEATTKEMVSYIVKAVERRGELKKQND